MKISQSDAKKIAQKITNEQVDQMLEKAAYSIRDWNVRSRVNKTFSIAWTWNILASKRNSLPEHRRIRNGIVANLILDFGHFLPKNLIPLPRQKKEKTKIKTTKPNLSDYKKNS